MLSAVQKEDVSNNIISAWPHQAAPAAPSSLELGWWVGAC